MEFIELKADDVLIMLGAALGMSLDHNGDTFYVLSLIGSDMESNEKLVTFAVPPHAVDKFLRVANGMDPKREQSV